MKEIYQDDVKVICKCGVEMEFKYMDFALSHFDCRRCDSMFVHDDYNNPNEKGMTTVRKYNKLKQKLEKIKNWHYRLESYLRKTDLDNFNVEFQSILNEDKYE